MLKIEGEKDISDLYLRATFNHYDFSLDETRFLNFWKGKYRRKLYKLVPVERSFVSNIPLQYYRDFGSFIMVTFSRKIKDKTIIKKFYFDNLERYKELKKISENIELKEKLEKNIMIKESSIRVKL